jgi:hypothetical protein
MIPIENDPTTTTAEPEFQFAVRDLFVILRFVIRQLQLWCWCWLSLTMVLNSNWLGL